MALSNVREIKKVAPSKGLSRLIDQAGELNAQKNDFEAAYNKLRGEIALQMPMAGDVDVLYRTGEDYEAKHWYPAEKRIDPEKLFKYNKDLFWRLIKVSLQDAEKQLPADVYYKMLEVKLSDAPRLTITKIKRKRAS